MLISSARISLVLALAVAFCGPPSSGAQTTPGSIHEAAERGDLGAVARIAQRDPAQVRAFDSYRSTPLHFAAASGHREVVDYLLAHGADPNARNNAQETPLYGAALAGHAEVVQVLLAHGANLSLASTAGPPINVAALLGNTEVVRVLLDHGADVNSRNSSGETPLHAAIRPKLGTGVPKPTVELLLARGADLEAKNTDGQTPLHTAAANSTPEAVELLLRKGANVHAKDVAGQTPLHAVVAKEGQAKREIVALLLTRHPDVNARDVVGYTPLHVLARMKLGLFTSEAEARGLLQDQAEAARLLIASGAVVDARDDYDSTPLHWAAWSDSEAVAELVLVTERTRTRAIGPGARHCTKRPKRVH